MSYSVNVYDRAGLYHKAGGIDWAGALALYDSFRKQFPDKAVHVFNLDRCDYNTDGLTEEEREALDERPVNAAPAAKASP